MKSYEMGSQGFLEARVSAFNVSESSYLQFSAVSRSLEAK